MEFDKLEKEYRTLYPKLKKLCEPYVRETDNRRIIRIVYNDKTENHKQYAKVLLEIKLGRVLGRDETVDHIDGNKLNDNIDNLQLLSREDNAAKGATRRNPIIDNCLWCSKQFELTRDQITRSKTNAKKAGPFCSRSCSGKYGAELQNNRTEALQRTEYEVKYYKLQDQYHDNSNFTRIAYQRL